MSKRERVFNVPVSVAGALATIAAIHIIRNLLPEEWNFTLLLAFAFIPARYTGDIADIPGGDIAGITSLVTYMLVHADGMHLAVNSLWMLAFGSAIAKRVGNIRFLAFSVACGVAGILTHLALHYGDVLPVVGASAAISGQMAAALRFLLGARRRFSLSPDSITNIPLASVAQTLKNPGMLVFMAIWAALNLVFGLGFLSLGQGDAGIAWEAHIGGFLFGLFGVGLFDRPARPEGPGQTPG
ncbi:MAG: rhomboid family intramembrane serine protease [Hyphomicrobiales bacterium]|nr:rhomboid family intramembrane serine protease [Hyphomicrobiales bacterium]